MARSAQKTAAERDSTAESSTTDIDMPAATRSFLLLLAFVCFLFTIVFFPAFTGLSVVNETGNTSVNETQESTAPSYDNLNTTPENITITGDTDNTTLIQEIPENITEEIDAPEPVAANISAPDYPETPPFPPASPPPTQPEGAGGCTAPSDDLHINNDTILCEGIWSLADVNDDGLLILNASNYTLSGNGTVISGDSTGYGILTNSTAANITITNLTITGFNVSIYLNSSENFTITNTDLDNNSYSIFLDAAHDNQIFNNTFNATFTDVLIKDPAAVGNLFYYNNFTGPAAVYVNASHTGNHFNTTAGGKPHGNAWDDLRYLDIYDADSDGFGDSGTQYPYNSTFSSRIINATDWGPMVAPEICSPPASGDWEITGLEVCRNRIINISGYIYINASDTLELHDATLNFTKSGSGTEFVLQVDDGGNLSTHDNTTIRRGTGGGDFYIRIFDQGFAHIENTTILGTDPGRMALRVDSGGANLELMNVSSGFANSFRLYGGTSIIVNRSFLDNSELIFSDGETIGITDIDDDLPSLTYDFSTSGGSSLNITDTTLNNVSVVNDGAVLSINSSDIDSFTHYNHAGYNTSVNHSQFRLFHYYNYQGGASATIRGLPAYPIYNLTLNLSTRDNNLAFSQSNITSGTYYYSQQSSFAEMVNSTWYSIEVRDSYLDMTDSSIQYLAEFYSGSPGANFTNSDLTPSQYIRLSDQAVLNFTPPYSNLSSLFLEGNSENPAIAGYVNITGLYSWESGSTLSRYFPFNVTYAPGMPASGINFTVKRGTAHITQGTTGADGGIILDISYDDSAGNGETNFTVYLDSIPNAKFRMLNSSAPDGIRIDATAYVDINLIDPPEKASLNDTIKFECDASGVLSLVNATLWHNYSGSWSQSGSHIDLSTSAAQVEFKRSGFISAKTFDWNCQVCNIADECFFSSANSTIDIDNTPPETAFQPATPDTATKVSTRSNWAFIDVSVTDTHNTSALLDWDRSLVAWLRFENSTGDSSTYGNDASCSGAACPEVWTGKRGKAFRLNGTDEYVRIPNHDSIETRNALTWEVWFNCPVQDQADEYPRMLDINDCSLAFGQSDGDYLRWWLNNGSWTPINSGTVCDNSWHHFAGTWNGTLMTMYIDSVAIGTQPLTGSLVTDGSDFDIGGTGTDTSYKGLVDEVKIWKRALSAEEVRSSYRSHAYALRPNMTGLPSGTYTYRAYAVDAAGNLNQTEQRTFSVNFPPNASNLILNSSSGLNKSFDNLTVHYDYGDDDADTVKRIAGWYVDGASITVLNMPFESTGGNESVWARDYSGNDNHASHVSAFWNSSGGYDGWGAYECDSSDDYLLIPEHSSLEQADAMTVSLWLYSKDASANYEALNYRMDSDRFNGAYQVRDDQVHVSVFNGSGADDIVVPFPEIPADSWHHVAFTFSRAEQNISVYINGSFYSSNSTGGDFPVYYSGASKQGLVIGKAGTAERPWNGSIDEVLIFDRVLSPGQLEGIYEGDFWTVTSDDIGGGDSWQVCITPNDGVEDGGTVCSNNLTVGELTAPSPFLPANNSIITDSRNPLYVWNNTAHPSAVSLTYDIEVANVSDFSSSVVNATAVAEGSVNSSYWNTSALSFITDYFWRVRARYGAEVSDWTGAMKYNILPVTSCAQPMDEMDFGQMCIYEDQDRCNDEGLGSHINDTLDNHPPPYVFENDGNLRTNGTVYSTPLWESTSKGDMPFRYYQFMLEAREAGTYSWALDSAWVNMSASEGSAPLSLHSFRWENASDEFNLHIRLEVPTDEPPGAKYSTTYAICEQNETY